MVRDAEQVEIEVLTVPDCPNAAPTVAQVRRALDLLDLREIAIKTRVITNQKQAEKSGFTGSPTILINGTDPFADPEQALGLSCRLYAKPNGLAGSPGLEALRQALAMSDG